MTANLITHPNALVKSRDVVFKIGAVQGINRPFATYTDATKTEIASVSKPGVTMYELQGATTANYQISDDEQNFRFLGDGGWTDAVTVNSRVQASITTYFLRDLNYTGTGTGVVYSLNTADLDEGAQIVRSFSNNKEAEAWIEIYSLIGEAPGGYAYDLKCFAAYLMNYQENYPADNLIEVSFDAMSRGVAYRGKFISPTLVATGLPNV